MSQAANRAAEAAARASYGRLVALLARRSRDIAAAQDALSEAFRSALETWPVRGIPERPEAWLLAVARRNLGRVARHARVVAGAVPTLELVRRLESEAEDVSMLPDERLTLMFVCAHPAIDPAARTPLMLQAVLGLDAARIASAFLVTPAAMSQRLVRAKTKIKAAGIRFAAPAPDDLAPRLEAVMEAIYAAFGSGWHDSPGSDPRGRDLTEEAIFLARVLVGLMPTSGEARGLLALMLGSEARRQARRSADGAFVPLSEQDRSLWSQEMIEEAERELEAASRLGSIGRFQIEAAIQSAHNARTSEASAREQAIAQLYDGLVRVHASIGALVGRAAAHAAARGEAAGLTALDGLEDEARAYQPYWALKAHLLAGLGLGAEAASAYSRAIGLSEDQAVRDYLTTKKSALQA